MNCCICSLPIIDNTFTIKTIAGKSIFYHNKCNDEVQSIMDEDETLIEKKGGIHFIFTDEEISLGEIDETDSNIGV